MTTPTTIRTSMITTATTMMTDLVVVPSHGRLVVGCRVLLTGTIPVVINFPTVSRGEVVLTVWEGVVSSGVDAVKRKLEM